MLNAKYPSKFQVFQSSSAVNNLLNDFSIHQENICVRNKSYKASDLLLFYINNLSLSKEDLRLSVNALDSSSCERFESRLAYSLLDNYSWLVKYKSLVEMVNALE
jgi:hypothetical protein